MSVSKMEDLLYPLADMAQADLKYSASERRISSNRGFSMPLMHGAKLNITFDAVSSFVNVKEQQAGILYHVKGHLYVLVAHNAKGRAVSAYIISSKELGLRRLELVDYLPKLCTIKTAVNKLSKGVKKAYMRNANGIEWSEVPLPC